jgi:hypothetical protein
MAENENQPQQRLFLDEKSFLAEFMFDPDIHEDASYKHLDKNLALTRLSSRHNEPERARALLEALHTITKTKYFYETENRELDGYQEEKITYMECSCGKKYEGEEIVACECGEQADNKQEFIQKTPIYKIVKKKTSFFPKSYHLLKSRFYSLTTTASARDGHLLRSATTTHLSKEESIEDRTAVKGRWGGFGNNSQQQKRY